MGHSRRRRSRKEPWWIRLDHDELLDVRLCDLDLRIAGTALEARIHRLHAELGRAGLRFRPHVWLSTGWFTPDGVPGFAVPFYLAHPRLVRIEHGAMLEVEGGSREWCMKLLRHEAGHALDNAHRLHRRARWRAAFGSRARPYGRSYQPDPASRRFVLNLDAWYSQSHPTEDWAECFAVWLQPSSSWRRRYAGWPALRKLEAVEALVGDVAARPAPVRTRRQVDPLRELRLTLRDYYRRKQAAYAPESLGAFDRQLLRLFADDPSGTRRPTAAAFLRRHRQALCAQVAAMTGQYRYAVHQALREMIAGCKKMRLRLTRSQRDTRVAVAALLTFVTMNLMRSRKREFWR